MKKILNAAYEIILSINRARAAAHLTRMGFHDKATQLLSAD